MGGCTVRIVTRSEGNTSAFEARGSLVRTDGGAEIEYVQGGDRVTLRFCPAAFSMDRRGNVCLSARFEAGKDSLFSIGDGGAHGEVPLRTLRYSLRSFGNKFQIALDYELRFDNSVLYRLELFVLEDA